MQRACAAALLRKGETILHNPGHSDDDKAAIEIIKALGATVEVKDGGLRVISNGINPAAGEFNCGESGLSIRMFTPIAALSDIEITIDGSGSLVTRPMDFFDEILPKLGVKIKSNNGKLPLRIQGPLRPTNIEVDGSLSSQFLTGLLMAYGACPNSTWGEASGSKASTIIKVTNLKSKPYIDLTLDVMQKFDLSVPQNNNYEEFIFYRNPSEALPAGLCGEASYTVESDWSSGAFLLVSGAIAGPVTVQGLDLTSAQADKSIVDALMAANAAIAMDAKGITVHPGVMDGFYFDATDCPDLFPPLVSLAAYCRGITTIKGTGRLVYKESNRALSLQDEFDKMGVRIELNDELMTVYGGGKVKGADVHSHLDHRIAMACAVTALGADSEMVIDEAGAVNKSYPDFYNDLKTLGASVSLPNNLINRITS
jgi:3-phosphoshikimate 1-carboxyvinyltransferase